MNKAPASSTIKKGVSIVSASDERTRPVLIDNIEVTQEVRFDTKCAEFNRVLGGGLVPGSMVLIGGEPGIGKSTLVLQVVLNIEGKKTLYVSGEESLNQLKMRAERLGTYANKQCYFVSDNSLERIFTHKECAARVADYRLCTDYRDRIGGECGRKCVAGQRVCRTDFALCKGEQHTSVDDWPYHERRYDCRTEDFGTHRRHGDSV